MLPSNQALEKSRACLWGLLAKTLMSLTWWVKFGCLGKLSKINRRFKIMNKKSRLKIFPDEIISPRFMRKIGFKIESAQVLITQGKLSSRLKNIKHNPALTIDPCVGCKGKLANLSGVALQKGIKTAEHLITFPLLIQIAIKAKLNLTTQPRVERRPAKFLWPLDCIRWQSAASWLPQCMHACNFHALWESAGNWFSPNAVKQSQEFTVHHKACALSREALW